MSAVLMMWLAMEAFMVAVLSRSVRIAMKGSVTEERYHWRKVERFG